jgi:hypothetical protein
MSDLKRLRAFARSHGYKPRPGGAPPKWDDDILCKNLVKVRMAMLKHKTTKVRTAIEKEMAARKDKWPIDIVGHGRGPDDYVEIELPIKRKGRFHPQRTSQGVLTAYYKALAKMRTDPQFKQQCEEALAGAEKWLPRRVTVTVTSDKQLAQWLTGAEAQRIREHGW